jgi:hypothetical protein
MATSLNPVTVAPRDWSGGWDSRQLPPGGHAGLLSSSGGWISRLDCRSARAGKEAVSIEDGRMEIVRAQRENVGCLAGKYLRRNGYLCGWLPVGRPGCRGVESISDGGLRLLRPVRQQKQGDPRGVISPSATAEQVELEIF